MLCLTIRLVYRLVALAGGWNSKAMHQEMLFNIFDGAMVIQSMVMFIMVHPGKHIRSEDVPSVNTGLPLADFNQRRNHVCWLRSLFCTYLSWTFKQTFRNHPSRDCSTTTSHLSIPRIYNNNIAPMSSHPFFVCPSNITDHEIKRLRWPSSGCACAQTLRVAGEVVTAMVPLLCHGCRPGQELAHLPC